jgi:hypothetical protein
MLIGGHQWTLSWANKIRDILVFHGERLLAPAQIPVSLEFVMMTQLNFFIYMLLDKSSRHKWTVLPYNSISF